jgi:hypothetical protein
MPYITGTNQLARTKDATLQASVTRTATANGTGLELADCGTLRLDFAVTAASGTTPTLDVKVQTSPDGTTWTDVSGGSFTQATGTTTQHKVISNIDRYVRHVATIGGTSPSFTYSLTGDAA